jgi:hypothetical protein
LALASPAACSGSDESADQWIVAVHAGDDRTYDEPCLPGPEPGDAERLMDVVTDFEASSSGGEYNALIKVGSQAGGDAVLSCYEASRIAAELRVMTASDRETWDEWRG